MLATKARLLPKSWKDTLQLPKSTFPPRAPTAEAAARYLKLCTDDLYAWQQTRKTPDVFTLHDGPPYANGDLHIGHALNKILKDITCRVQLLRGRKINYVPGWDCHGLPIELKALELQRNADLAETSGIDIAHVGTALQPIQIRTMARRLAAKTTEKQKGQFKEWAVMADWQNSWKTMDLEFEMKQLEVFKAMVGKGLIYRRLKPVYWSPSTRTALAEAELEYRDDHVSTAAFVKFNLHTIGEDLTNMLQPLGVENIAQLSVVIWTTMPWTLPANRAIGFNPAIDYSIVRTTDETLLVIASDRCKNLEKELHSGLEVLASFAGSLLKGSTYSDELWHSEPQIRPLLPFSTVQASTGSGLAHLAPGHGPEDYEACLEAGIEPFAPVDDAGAFVPAACPAQPSLLTGKAVMKEGNTGTIDWARKKGMLLRQHAYTHRYPYDWRSKMPVIFRATPQWFANVASITDSVLKSLEAVKFIPEHGQNRLSQFVRGRREWCISRQRSWGVPIPALHHIETNDAVLSEDTIEHIIHVIRERGIDAWWRDPEDNPAWIPKSLCTGDSASNYRRSKETMDVWFDSGTSWTQTLLGDGVDNHVADLYLEGTDQHRGWFQSSLLTYVAQQSSDKAGSSLRAPFKNLVTHGFVLDQHGRKMSKSEGNVVSPKQIMDGSLLPPIKQTARGQTKELRDGMGHDALRLWVAGCDFTNDVLITPEALKHANTSLKKYRIILKQLLGLISDWDPLRRVTPEQLSQQHKIALWQSERMQAKVRRHFDDMGYHQAASEINRYVYHDLSAFYLEIIKDAAYCGTPIERQMVQDTVAILLIGLQQVLAPVIPTLVEESWDHVPQSLQSFIGTSPLRTSFQDPILNRSAMLQDSERDQFELDMPNLKAILSAIQNAQEEARTHKLVGSSLQSNVSVTFQDPHRESQSNLRVFLELYRDDMATLSVTSSFAIDSGPPDSQQHAWCYSRDVEVSGQLLKVHVFAPREHKCVRCWRYLAPSQAAEDEPNCARCQSLLSGMK